MNHMVWLIPYESYLWTTLVLFRKRRSSPNYKDHIALEKLTIKLGKTLKKNLTCYVICAGVCYGNGEQILHSFFKQAWLGEESLPIYGTAHNGEIRVPQTDFVTVTFSYSSYPCQRSCINRSLCLGFKTKNPLYPRCWPGVSIKYIWVLSTTNLIFLVSHHYVKSWKR